MKISRNNLFHWLLLCIQGANALLTAALRKFMSKPGRPLVVLYGHQLSGNLLALYEEWDGNFRDEMDMYFLSLDPAYANTLESKGYWVLRCHRPGDMLKVGRCACMITDHGLHALELLIHLTDIRFIDVWHGIPFKGFVPDDFRLQHKYDEVWVSSPLLKQLYVEKFGFDEDKVVPLGYARTDKLFRRDPPRDDLKALFNIPEDHKIVLYAPTWQQDSEGRELFPFGESQESFTSGLAQVCAENKATLVIRSHLNAEIPDSPRANVVYCSMRDYADTEELLLHTDVLITDWSSIAFDFLALERPAIFLDVPAPFKHGFSLGAEYRFGVVSSDLPSLSRDLQALLHSEPDHSPSGCEMLRERVAEIYDTRTIATASETQIGRLSEGA